MSASTLDDLVEAYARVSSLNHQALSRFVEVGVHNFDNKGSTSSS